MQLTKIIPKSIIFLKDSKELQRLLGFSFFIQCNWSALGSILPFWFEQTKSLQNFVYYYSVLTFTAGTSFLWTNLIDKLDIKKIGFLIPFLYLLRGILILFSTSILSSIISGICGGMCIVLYTLISKSWINNWEEEIDRSHIIIWTSSTSRIANILPISIAGLGISILGTKIFELSIMIILSSIMPLVSYFFLKHAELKIEKKPVIPILSKVYQCFQANKSLMIWDLLCSFTLGLHFGLFYPYLSLILNKIGFNPTAALGLISIGNLVKLFFQPTFSIFYKPSKKGTQILILGILNTVFFSMWGINLSPLYLSSIVILTLLLQTAFMFVETNVIYAIFPKEWFLLLSTIGMFTFHVSNIIGSFLGNIMISNGKIKSLIFISAFLIGIGGLLYYLLIKSLKSLTVKN